MTYYSYINMVTVKLFGGLWQLFGEFWLADGAVKYLRLHLLLNFIIVGVYTDAFPVQCYIEVMFLI